MTTEIERSPEARKAVYQAYLLILQWGCERRKREAEQLKEAEPLAVDDK